MARWEIPAARGIGVPGFPPTGLVHLLRSALIFQTCKGDEKEEKKNSHMSQDGEEAGRVKGTVCHSI